jgi:DNA-directed RNA polymerase specialized sigma24 family protein
MTGIAWNDAEDLVQDLLIKLLPQEKRLAEVQALARLGWRAPLSPVRR